MSIRIPVTVEADEKVYGAAERPELRLITCGGGYSKQTGYQANVVVFAHLTGVR